MDMAVSRPPLPRRPPRLLGAEGEAPRHPFMMIDARPQALCRVLFTDSETRAPFRWDCLAFLPKCLNVVLFSGCGGRTRGLEREPGPQGTWRSA